jgi:hypothetical protein
MNLNTISLPCKVRPTKRILKERQTYKRPCQPTTITCCQNISSRLYQNTSCACAWQSEGLGPTWEQICLTLFSWHKNKFFFFVPIGLVCRLSFMLAWACFDGTMHFSAPSPSSFTQNFSICVQSHRLFAPLLVFIICNAECWLFSQPHP